MERIQIDDFSQVKMLSQLQASPSGEKLAFVVTQAQVKANKYVSHIHLLENCLLYTSPSPRDTR